MEAQDKLQFKISSHLKSIIGRDLITDDNVAIFELVKNSFDAGATFAKLHFDKNNIYIVDNGKGMSRDDFINKWLFVAYSAKMDGTEDSDIDYRDKIATQRRYAGSKGVGRFSCDRLGSDLEIQSRPKDQKVVSSLSINWNEFEESMKDEFSEIDVQYRNLSDFNLPEWVEPPYQSGTALHIYGLREDWTRKKLEGLKASLSKLINPFGQDETNFYIEISAPQELEADQHYEKTTPPDEQVPNKVINGPVKNFIFQTLQEKTTWIRSWIDNESNLLRTELTDRGKTIYKISEKLPFPTLANSNFNCNIFYLNRASKHTFALRMGVSSIDFGSVFLFKNGFRIYPVGEKTDDTFGIDRRKQQGYARFLGTRDILGRIDVEGDESQFKESSSRDKGLIETDAYHDLVDCFWEKCLKRLEKYVVGVSWTLKLDMDSEDPSFLSGDEAKSKVIDVITKLASSPEISIDYYAEDLLDIIDHQNQGLGKTISNLSALAEHVGDNELAHKVEEARRQINELQRHEAQALEYAEKERRARREAEKEAKKAERELKTEKERNLFLSSQQSRDEETLENLHHQVIIYATNAISQIEADLYLLKFGNKNFEKNELVEKFGNLLDWNKHIVAASRFATSANFKMQSNKIEEDLPVFVRQYIETVCPMYESRLAISVTGDPKPLTKRFTPIEISIIIDNLIDNAKKADANSIEFDLASPEPNFLQIKVKDDGFGITEEITNHEDMFLKGVTTTEGSGIGLFNVRSYLEAINGSIEVEETSVHGTTFRIRVYK